MVRDWLLEEESGQGMVEYALILVLIAVAAIGTMGLLADEINTLFTDITAELTNRP